ncbi:multiple epidermal growth factor-like domains 11 [Plakobranchus ocellatus]|uniref:Multiple epidermal growth factor-like domains 11 n=1 Tax=Plakobranchus ocellatus TaxID=259542 RepID=A0AAV3XZJ9_9GAST|nr:multiple epidermal growth factor-like domains 11 [Plakobranchus ocellatus]
MFSSLGQHNASQGCLPYLPCSHGCMEGYSHNTKQAKTTNSCNETSAPDANPQFCPCENSTCYSFNSGDLCLNTCEEHNTEAIKACVLCLESLDKTQVETGGNINFLCENFCEGMCVDVTCSFDILKANRCSTCVPGYTGEHCQDPCSSGCGSKCHPDSGYCLECPVGMFGPECEFPCSPTCLGGNCSLQWGTCEKCALGFQGADCNEPCPSGLYGDNCSKPCSENCRSGCNSVTGSCQEGCKPGYFGLRCEQKCPTMTFGQNCLSQCPVTCFRNVPCHHETGKCVSGCESGFYGDHCNNTCEEHKYGYNCEENCSANCFRQLCNAFSGICLACVETNYGPMCEFIISLGKINDGVLGSDVSAGEALLMISGILLFGVLMWIGVAYLLFHQRRRILKDATKGIDPRISQWGMFPNSMIFHRAVRLYDRNRAKLGGGDATLSSTRNRKDKSKRPLHSGDRKKRKRKKMLSRAFKRGSNFPWWIKSEAEKPSLPSAVEMEIVSKWLSLYHGIEQPNKNEEDVRIDESAKNYKTHSSNNSARSTDIDKAQSKTTLVLECDETATAQKRTDDQIVMMKDETAQSSEAPINDGAPLLCSTQSLAVVPSQELTQKIPSSEHEITTVPARKDSIFLSPKAHPRGSSAEGMPKYRKETSRVQWIRDKFACSSGTTQSNSESSKGHSEMTESSTTGSRTETTRSSSSTITSRYTVSDTDISSSDDATESYSSDVSDEEASEDSSLSTVITTQRNENRLEQESTFSNMDDLSVVESKKEDTDTDASETGTVVPSLLQKFIGAFKKNKPNSQLMQIDTAPQHFVPSVPGAGGLPRPYSHKFLITRLETWSRNRGIEVIPNDGMLEVADNLNLEKSHGPGFELSRVPENKATRESSWVSTDETEGTQSKRDNSSKLTSRRTGTEIRTSTMTTDSDKLHSRTTSSFTTSDDNYSLGVPTVSGPDATIKYEDGETK